MMMMMCLVNPKSQFPVRPCAAPVGMQSGRIKNTAMTASSSYNVFHGPYLARLHRFRTGRYMGAWVARIRNANQYLQIALGRPMKITGIATQGRHDANQWVKRYLVAFSQDNMHFEYYMEYGNFKVWYFQRALSQIQAKTTDKILNLYFNYTPGPGCSKPD